MNINIFCRWFGHRFIRKIGEQVHGPYAHTDVMAPTDFCVKCGLTKEEIVAIEDNQYNKNRDWGKERMKHNVKMTKAGGKK